MSPENPQRSAGLGPWRDALMILVLAGVVLWAAAGVLIPLVLAAFVFVLILALSDHIRALMPAFLPGWLATVLALLVALSGLFAVMFVLANQATQFARALPGYEAQLESALGRLVAVLGGGGAEALRQALVDFDLSWLARNVLGGARSFLSSFLLISLYVAFMMAERRMMAHKLILAANDRQISDEISATLDKIALSLQRYVGVKTFISSLTAGLSYLIFLALGLEYAETWAVLTFLLNFIPSIGSIIAVIFPAMVSAVQFDTLMPFVVIAFGCGGMQFAIGNFLDPALLGRSLNISSLVVILSLVVWTALWGLPGAFLSTPLTVCVLLAMAQFPALRPLAVMMSKDGRLDPPGAGRTL